MNTECIIIEPLQYVLLVKPTCPKIDYMIIDKMQRQIGIQAMTSAKNIILFDLSEIELISSMILGALVKMLKNFQEEGKRMILVGLDRHNRPSIRLSRLDSLFEVHDSVAAALAVVAPPDKV